MVCVCGGKTRCSLGLCNETILSQRDEDVELLLGVLCEVFMTLLVKPVYVKPYIMLEIPHILEFFIRFWDENFQKLHGLDQGSDIGNTTVLDELHIVVNILQTLANIRCILWFSTVKCMILHSLYIVFDAMLVFL